MQNHRSNGVIVPHGNGLGGCVVLVAHQDHSRVHTLDVLHRDSSKVHSVVWAMAHQDHSRVGL